MTKTSIASTIWLIVIFVGLGIGGFEHFADVPYGLFDRVLREDTAEATAVKTHLPLLIAALDSFSRNRPSRHTAGSSGAC